MDHEHERHDRRRRDRRLEAIERQNLLIIRQCALVIRQNRHALYSLKELHMNFQDLATAVGHVKDEVDKFRPAIDKFEARVTQLLKGKLNPADQAALDKAVNDLRGTADTAKQAIADAADEIDEASILGASFPDRAAFDAAVTGYTGAQQITLDGTEVKPGDAPPLEYFTAADGSISNTNPNPPA